MNIYNILLENSELLRIIYSLIIGLICGIIFIKTNKFFKLSSHEGIRYFRNAFFFYGLAFLTRYFFGVIFSSVIPYSLTIFIFEYFVILAGFFLIYSLIWKKFNSSYSSLFNSKVILFHLIALIIAFLGILSGTYNFMFYSQIILFFYASLISYSNYNKNPQHKFLKFYFIAILLGLFIWTLNLLASILFSWNPLFLLNIGIINLIFFLLVLYGIIKVTRR